LVKEKQYINIPIGKTGLYEYGDQVKTVWLDKWYDRHTRSWIIQLKDDNDYQIGDAIYCGNKDESIILYNDLLKEYGVRE